MKSTKNMTIKTTAVSLLTMLVVTAIGVTPVLIQTAHAQNFIMLGSFSPMNDETLQYIKEYLIDAIQNNLTASSSVQINGDLGGQMSIMEQGESMTDSADDIFIIIGAGFSEENGYRYEDGRLFAPNGTQILPR